MPRWSAFPTSSGARRWLPRSCCKAGRSVSAAELQDWVKQRLRSSRAPQRIEFRTELPYTETGKLLRRQVRAELAREA